MSRNFWKAQRNAIVDPGVSCSLQTRSNVASSPFPVVLSPRITADAKTLPWRPPVHHSSRGPPPAIPPPPPLRGRQRPTTRGPFSALASSNQSTAFPLAQQETLQNAAAELLKDLKSCEGAPKEAIQALHADVSRLIEQQKEHTQALRDLTVALENRQAEDTVTKQNLQKIKESVEWLVERDHENRQREKRTKHSPVENEHPIRVMQTPLPVRSTLNVRHVRNRHTPSNLLQFPPPPPDPTLYQQPSPILDTYNTPYTNLTAQLDLSRKPERSSCKDSMQVKRADPAQLTHKHRTQEKPPVRNNQKRRRLQRKARRRREGGLSLVDLCQLQSEGRQGRVTSWLAQNEI